MTTTMSANYFLFVLLVTSALSAELPTYLDKCNTSSPRLNECIVRNGNKGIPHIVKGDPQYNVPNFQPLLIPALMLINDNDLQLIIRTVKVFGNDRAKITDADLDLDTREYRSAYFIPNLEVLSQYQINGTLFGQTIYGAGRLNITVVNGEYFSYLRYVVSPADYAFTADTALEYKVERVFYEFTDLYDGQELRGHDMNEMINEHWEDLHMRIKPAASQILAEVITSAYQSFTNIIHWADMFYH